MLPALCLIPLVALLRVLLGWHGAAVYSNWLVGITPLSAVALCGGVYLPKRWSLVIPLGILLFSDWILDRHFGVAFFTPGTAALYLVLAAIGWFGMWMRRSPRLIQPGVMVLATIASSTFFYVVTNALAWLGSSLYAQTATGLFQALTVGLPGYLPSYYFYRNALVSDVLYSIVFVASVRRSRKAGRHSIQSVGREAVAAV